jgi:hypothetical protein
MPVLRSGFLFGAMVGWEEPTAQLKFGGVVMLNRSYVATVVPVALKLV